MKKNMLQTLFIISLITTIILLYLKFTKILIIPVTLTILLGLTYFYKCRENIDDKKDAYNKMLSNIVKTYETILVDVEKTPELEGKDIVITSSFDKMVDIQYVVKKPIIYKKSYSSCSFVLMDSEVAYIYILREDNNSYSPLDSIISLIELNNIKRNRDKKTLDDIDKTTIIKLDNEKEYKVSPVRKMDITKVNKITEEDKESTSNKKENKKIVDVLEEIEVL